uniref:Uncharacterized protein n=1 Tax=Megaselia scalaris TaxID=36166 RepID=T1GSM7_MEGSC
MTVSTTTTTQILYLCPKEPIYDRNQMILDTSAPRNRSMTVLNPNLCTLNKRKKIVRIGVFVEQKLIL